MWSIEVNISYYSFNEGKNSYKQESAIHNFEEKFTINILLHSGTILEEMNVVMQWLSQILKN
ncbi:MAG: hypothetical protein Ta2E_01550 [Mycoplasmoidaceae bacterium]|nr:MAG: hypothetical protein Ta2E_01550 [Mycoplasmoidaceae bacterium]